MTLGRKVVLATIIFGAIITIGALGVMRVKILPEFQALEVQWAEKDRARVLVSDTTVFDEIQLLTEEYAYWDPLYEEVRKGGTEMIAAEMKPANWLEGSANAVLVFSDSDELLYGWVRPAGEVSLLPIEQEMLFDVQTPGPQVMETLRETRGFMWTASGLLRIVSMPITDTIGEADPVGTMLIGRFVTDETINDMARVVSGTVIADYDRGNTPVANPSYDYTISIEEHTVVIRQPVYDVFNARVGDIVIETERSISAAGRTSITQAIAFIGAGIVTMLIFGLLFLNNQVVAPLESLTRVMSRMRTTGNLVMDEDGPRKDEIGQLANEFRELVTRVDRARSELEEARDDAVAHASSKSEFLARMSHEIRTPMNGVIGMTELLKNTDLTDHQSRCVRTIGESGSTMLTLIDDILDFSKIDAGKLTLEAAEVCLRDLLEETAEGFAESAGRKGIELVSIIPAEANAIVRTDPTRLRQVLVNLMGNALKFTESGEVVLSVEGEPRGDVLHLTFSVRDTGPGIDEDARDRIFEAFSQEDSSTTRVYGGTGLGLAISHQIVDVMGGRLTLESAVGEGSRFYFSLELPRVREVGEHSLPMKDRRIVVIDDNASVRQALTGLLEHLGASVMQAEHLTALPALLDEHSPDVLIVEGRERLLNGASELRRLMDSGEPPGLIFSSPITDMLERADLEEWSASARITKPVRLGDLESALLTATGLEAPVVDQPEADGDDALQGRILLAEDNAVNQMVAVGVLQFLGLEVEVVENGKEAVDRYIVEDFDAILMDCQMPVMDGFKATQAIREWEKRSGKPRMPIIALTANALATDRQLCIYAGMDDYLAKPFKPEELREILETWLSGKGERASA